MKPDLSIPLPNPDLAPSQNGFSVIEALVTMSILGILTALAAPQFSSYATKLTLRSEASRVRLFLERSAAYAITSRETVEIEVSRTMLAALRPGGAQRDLHTLRHNTQLKLPSGETTTVLLYPTITASPATLVLTKGGLSCSVIVSLRTRVRIVC